MVAKFFRRNIIFIIMLNQDDLQKLKANLEKELETIENQLREIASENPAVKGDFDVRVEDLGNSMEDAAQEMTTLDQRQALVSALEKRRKEVRDAIDKIKSGTYGKCEKCSVAIKKERLIARPVAALCMDCAKLIR
jgi:RNA polymerase-binding transcription factor DksA